MGALNRVAWHGLQCGGSQETHRGWTHENQQLRGHSVCKLTCDSHVSVVFAFVYGIHYFVRAAHKTLGTSLRTQRHITRKHCVQPLHRDMLMNSETMTYRREDRGEKGTKITSSSLYFPYLSSHQINSELLISWGSPKPKGIQEMSHLNIGHPVLVFMHGKVCLCYCTEKYPVNELSASGGKS